MAYVGTFKAERLKLIQPLTFGIEPFFDVILKMAAQVATAVRDVNAKATLPDTNGFSEAQIYDTYSPYVENHGNAAAQTALVSGERVIVALRIPTNTRENQGQGVYDDRMAIIWKVADPKDPTKVTKHGKDFKANTEPSAQYEAKGATEVERVLKVKGKLVKKKVKVFDKIVGPDGKEVLSKGQEKWAGHDVNADKRLDAGRLAAGTYKFYNDKGTFLGDAYLRPRNSQTAERDVNHDGLFTNADTWTTPEGTLAIDTGDFGMYIHKGGASNTWSAGCQTLPPADHKVFFETLNSKQEDVYYVLVNL